MSKDQHPAVCDSPNKGGRNVKILKKIQGKYLASITSRRANVTVEMSSIQRGLLEYKSEANYCLLQSI